VSCVYMEVSGNPKTTNSLNINRKKNNPKYQPYILVHLVFPGAKDGPRKTKRAEIYQTYPDCD